ncbi:hypothetical protein [Cellulomonas sp.]|uniref:hypothetical protein n=1 Tax=Cellulomonas sp. TaxID=40001 RepID=UPI001B13263F|nr:hypothetical protein [Cellulomonas sp.]MBO9553887.1 hypothetical protein [Cellulomonas sp.]
MTDRASRFWGVRDGKVGLLSGRAALIAGLVLGAGSAWAHNWWACAAMAILVLRASIALWWAREAERHPARTAVGRPDDTPAHAES